MIEEFLVLPFMERRAEHWIVVLRCTPELAEAAVEASGEWIPIDLEQRGLPDPSAGWCRLEVREDGVWATGVKWTQAGREALPKAMHVVPALHLFENGDIRDFICLALTNDPQWRDVGKLH